MKKLYTFLDDNNFELYAQQLDVVPTEKHTEVIRIDFFIKPKFKNNIWIEGANQQEIEDYNLTLKNQL
jgi:predicted hydrolase (HD superfamily)